MKKSILLHIGIIIGLFAVACAYLSPALSGKIIRQGDIQKADAMAYEQREAKKEIGHMPHWASSMFSGMPGYQITNDPQHSVFQPARDVVTLKHLGLERNIGVIFLYLLGFYIAMLAFGVSPWLALVGALGFGLGSYNIIIIEAGHITKAWAMAMIAPVLAGMYLTLRSAVDPELDKRRRTLRVLWGSLLFTLALILQISFNHIQITFYTAIGCVFLAIAYLIVAIAKRRFASYALKIGLLIVGAVLAVGSNAKILLVNEEYARYTMRGGNELTVTPDDLYKDHSAAAAQNTSDGLAIDYAFSWSYGIGETYTLLVPGAMGGGSGEKVSTESAFYKTFRSTQAPLYWGDQPFTSGPVYFGAIVVFLFFLGLIVVKRPERWWLLAASVLAIMLSWGHNFNGFNEWLFNHVPLYNKFRTPSMALVLANTCIAILGVLALQQVFKKDKTDAERKRINCGLYCTVGGLMAFIILMLIASGSFNYTGASDRQMAAQYGSQWDMIFSVLVSDRAALFSSDSWRSLLFIVLAAATLWLCNNSKIKKPAIGIALVGLLVVIDLWGVDRRYLNNDNFCEKRQVELRRDKYDYDIDEQAAYFGDHDYRVFNMAVNTYNDSKPSAFHHQIGGYSAAKLSRYQNLIDFYLSHHIRPEVLNMLNARYFVMQNGQVQRNPDALGNAWFVQNVKAVSTANEEIMALNSINPAVTAVVNTEEFALPDQESAMDSSDHIELVPQHPYNPDYVKYTSHCSDDLLAVFSEIYYKPDWFAYIDGKPAEYFRANYILRAMVVPAGDHIIEFKNEAPRAKRLNDITLIVSLFTLVLMAGSIFLVYRKKEKKA